ncbi:unnamed protein product [Closterium sp. Naga37s-1]|nr:unnamed protein product [Closterium sp. Naga37s-1]
MGGGGCYWRTGGCRWACRWVLWRLIVADAGGRVEAAGEGCLVPGLKRPVIVMGVQVWPLEINSPLSWKAIEPMARELKTVSKLAEKAIDLMNAPLGR